MRILRFLSLTVLFLAAFAVAVGVWTVRRSFPVTAGTAVLPGRDGPVTVARHGAGVPHITATTLGDLFRAQGVSSMPRTGSGRWI